MFINLFFSYSFSWVKKRVNNSKDKLKGIIERLTTGKKSVFMETILFEAGEAGIGESLVEEGMNQLIAENFIYVPLKGVVKKTMIAQAINSA